MRRCSACKEEKDETEFFVKEIRSDGTKVLCSECKVCHAKRESERYYAKQAFIDSKKTPCAKCGEDRIRCITFHHKDPFTKDFTIGQIRKTNLKVFESEIDKCVCLCLNCHHEFHYLNSSDGVSLDEYLSA